MNLSTQFAVHLLWASLAAAAFFGGRSLAPDATRNVHPESRHLAKSSSRPGQSKSWTGRSPSPGGPASRTTSGASSTTHGALSGQLAFLRLLEDLSPADAEAALSRLAQFAPDSLAWRHNAQLLFETWAASDPETALARAGELKGSAKRTAMKGALIGWSMLNPASAQEWLDANEPNQSYTAAVVEGMARIDPDEATRFVTGLPSERRHWGNLIDVIATEQARRGTNVASSWALSLQDPDLREAAFANLAQQFVSTEGAASAAEWIRSHSGSPETGEAIEVVARTWALEDAATAARWLQSLPATRTSRILGEVVGRWTVDDPVAAGEFLVDLDPSPARSEAVYRFALRHAHEDPEKANKWAASIEDDRLRTRAVRATLAIWRRQDPAAAARWTGPHG